MAQVEAAISQGGREGESDGESEGGMEKMEKEEGKK